MSILQARRTSDERRGASSLSERKDREGKEGEREERKVKKERDK